MDGPPVHVDSLELAIREIARELESNRYRRPSWDGQNEADAKAADAATTEMRTVLFDPQNGYYAKRGKDAIDGAPDALRQLEAIKQKYTEGQRNREVSAGIAATRVPSWQRTLRTRPWYRGSLRPL